MTTADWALIIAIGSLAISLASFIWNVWSKFIYPKPKVRVSFGYMTILTPGTKGFDGEVLSLSATNMGPAAVTLSAAATKGRKPWWRWKHESYGLLNPLHSYPASMTHTIGPFSGGLPKKIEVGEQFSVYFVPDHEYLAGDDCVQIGFNDTFNRLHWAPKSDITRARPLIQKACTDSGKNYKSADVSSHMEKIDA